MITSDGEKDEWSLIAFVISFIQINLPPEKELE
jgi:hypothetical protein